MIILGFCELSALTPIKVKRVMHITMNFATIIGNFISTDELFADILMVALSFAENEARVVVGGGGVVTLDVAFVVVVVVVASEPKSRSVYVLVVVIRVSEFITPFP